MAGNSGSQATSSLTLPRVWEIWHDEVVGNSASHATSSLAPQQEMDWVLPPLQRHSSDRVKAYLGHGGTQVCLAGLGEGADFGTFPRHWTAGDMMKSGWIHVLKGPVENERPKAGVHYSLIEPPSWRPKAVVFHRRCPQESLITVREDKIGDLTEYISVLPTEATIAHEEPEEYAGDDKISTPGSPEPFVSPPY